MGTVGAVLLVVGLTLTPVALIGTSVYVVHLAGAIRSADPGSRPPWQLLALHLGIVAAVQAALVPLALVPGMGGFAGTGVGALAAMAILPVRLRARRRRQESGAPPDRSAVRRDPGTGRGASPRPSRPWALASWIGITGLLVPWLVAVAVKLYLDARGRPTLPFSDFVGPSEIPILVVLTLTSWAFPFVLLGGVVMAAPRPWLGDRPAAPVGRLPVWLAYAVGVAAALPLFVGVFREFDFIYLLVPLGLLLLVPMAVAYLVGVAVVRRRAAS